MTDKLAPGLYRNPPGDLNTPSNPPMSHSERRNHP